VARRDDWVWGPSNVAGFRQVSSSEISGRVATRRGPVRCDSTALGRPQGWILLSAVLHVSHGQFIQIPSSQLFDKYCRPRTVP